MADTKKNKEQIKDLRENMKSRENWAIFLGAGASAPQCGSDSTSDKSRPSPKAEDLFLRR